MVFSSATINIMRWKMAQITTDNCMVRRTNWFPTERKVQIVAAINRTTPIIDSQGEAYQRGSSNRW
jgi:hypothetical protein